MSSYLKKKKLYSDKEDKLIEVYKLEGEGQILHSMWVWLRISAWDANDEEPSLVCQLTQRQVSTQYPGMHWGAAVYFSQLSCAVSLS